MRREKSTPAQANNENQKSICLCGGLEELRRKDEEREQLLLTNQQLAAALNAAKTELVAARKKCARADILFMQYHVQKLVDAAQAAQVQPVKEPCDVGIQCDMPNMKKTDPSRKINSRHSLATDISRLTMNEQCRPKKQLDTAELIVTKKALRELKPVTYKEPSAKVKLRRNISILSTAMETVQQTPPRKQTRLSICWMPVSWTITPHVNNISNRLARLLHGPNQTLQRIKHLFPPHMSPQQSGTD
ncbi:unnamed protein product [Aphanomyces euteiches]